MSYFEPKMLAGEKLKVQLDLAYSAEQKVLFKSLAQSIFDNAVDLLMSASKIGTSDFITVNLSVNHLGQRYMFDRKLFNEVGVKREIEKLAAEQGLKVYQVEAGKIIITF